MMSRVLPKVFVSARSVFCAVSTMAARSHFRVQALRHATPGTLLLVM